MAQQKVIEYLHMAGYKGGGLTTRELKSMTLSEYEKKFKFLHLRLNPYYPYKRGKRFEDEFVTILKSLRFPCAEAFTSKQLYQIAAPHSYPNFLYVLSWLTDQCIEFDKMAEEAASQLNSTLNINQEIGPEEMDMLFFDYTTSTYNLFMKGHDDFKSTEDELYIIFESINEGGMEQIRQLTLQKDNLSKEIKELEKPLIYLESLRNKKKDAQSEISRLEDYIEKQKHRVFKYKEYLSRLSEEINRIKTDIITLEGNKSNLKLSLVGKDISDEEINRMTELLAQKEKESEELRVELEELQQKSWEKEIQMERARTDIERTVLQYNELTHIMKNIPLDELVEAIVKSDLVFDPNSDEMMSQDLVNDVLPVLKRIESDLGDSIRNDQVLELELVEQLGDLQESLKDHTNEFQRMLDKYTKKLAEYEIDKEEVMKESVRYNEKIDRDQRELRNIHDSAIKQLIENQQYQYSLDQEFNKLQRIAKEHKRKLYQQINLLVSDTTKNMDSINEKLNNLNT
ncbi:unnamed protein product [Cunninghamella echinulata]